MVIKYDKLVRDNIPEIIEKDGKIAKFEIVNNEEFLSLLVRKLFEECGEFSKSREIEELADILEVIENLAINLNSSLDEVIKIQKVKRDKRGGFSKKIKLIEVEDREN